MDKEKGRKTGEVTLKIYTRWEMNQCRGNHVYKTREDEEGRKRREKKRKEERKVAYRVDLFPSFSFTSPS